MPPGDDRIGTIIASRYRIRTLLGRGGMAVVYAADDEVLGRPVALKVFEVRDESEISRSAQEMHALARLNHPNLVTLFDAHLSSTNSSYFVMELVEGPNLRQAIDQRLLDGPQIAAIAFELAEALEAVHAAGIVHRDVKPANVLLTPTTLTTRPLRAKLADFGIAHLVGSSRVTSVGTIIGTAAYLSPEQLTAGQPGTPSDIYSLGLVLLEALGSGESQPRTYAEAISSRLIFNPVIPSNLPPGWARLLERMTNRDPDARPPADEAAATMSALARELDSWAAPKYAEPELAPTQKLSSIDSRTALPTEAVEVSQRRRPPMRAIPLIAAASIAAVVIAAGFIGALDLLASQSGEASVLTPTTSAQPSTAVTGSPPLPAASQVATVAPSGSTGQGKGHGNGQGPK
ncbi:MAG: serine/threonine protein kinase [Microbacteriaceae bacterium]|nr:serine/threonine protein kinase [Microbacteriaceae bacterium]